MSTETRLSWYSKVVDDQVTYNDTNTNWGKRHISGYFLEQKPQIMTDGCVTLYVDILGRMKNDKSWSAEEVFK